MDEEAKVAAEFIDQFDLLFDCFSILDSKSIKSTLGMFAWYTGMAR